MALTSRYDLMKESTVSKDTDGKFFPDVLSLNYKEKIQQSSIYNEPPVQYEIDERFKEKPYLFVYTFYQSLAYDTLSGKVCLDDIILDLNNIKHKDALNDGDTILFPSSTELSKFINSSKTISQG